MKTHSRSKQVADLIQRQLATLLITSQVDDRLKEVTITAVKISPDFSAAKVYVTLFDVSKKEELLEALAQAAPVFRKMLSKTIHTKRMPSLTFYFDDFIMQSRRISDLVNQTKVSDEGEDE